MFAAGRDFRRANLGSRWLTLHYPIATPSIKTFSPILDNTQTSLSFPTENIICFRLQATQSLLHTKTIRTSFVTMDGCTQKKSINCKPLALCGSSQKMYFYRVLFIEGGSLLLLAERLMRRASRMQRIRFVTHSFSPFTMVLQTNGTQL